MKNKPKLIRITTIPGSLKGLLTGQLKYMNNYFNVIGISSPGEKLAEVAQVEGVSVVAINMKRSISPLKDIKSVYDLYKILKREKPLIVHTHTPKAGTVGMLAAKFAGVPHRLHTIAGMPLMESTGIKRKILNLVEKATYACATKIYPNSRGLYDFILKNKFCSKSKLKVIAKGSSNGIDTEYFSPQSVSEEKKNELRKTLKIDNDDFIFIFVGRIVKDKGINELVEAFVQLSKNKKNIKLLLVGSFDSNLNPIKLESQEQIKTHPLIIHTGYQKDVRPYFAIANVLTFPSYREGFPNVVMQAGAMGLNCIVSDINGCNEIIKDHHNGLIIPPKNTEMLYTKMLWLFENKDENIKMSQITRYSIKENYERKYVWGEILKEYKSIIN